MIVPTRLTMNAFRHVSTAALHSLKRYNDAIAAYEEGLAKFPNDEALKKGIEEVKRDKDGPPRGMGGMGGMGMGGMNNPFGTQLMQKILLNPKTRPYLNDKEFMAKIQRLQTDPNSLMELISDPKVMEVLGMSLGGGMEDDDEDEPPPGKAWETLRKPQAPPTSSASSASCGSSCGDCGTGTKSADMDMEDKDDDVEDMTDETPAERKRREDQAAATKCKERGNELYKAKKFDEAVAAYNEAIALDPTNMTFANNKAAVYFTSRKWDECIEACQLAAEVGKANRAPYEERAKAYTRCAKAYQKKGDLEKAIEMCRQAQLESFDKATERMMKNMELDKKKADAAAYLDDGKADEAKERGNEHFRNKNW
jgi:stress-induced-phosphoprotein 1